MTDTPTPNLDAGYEVTLSVRDIETGLTVSRMTKVITFQFDCLETRVNGQWSQDAKRREFATKLAEVAKDTLMWAARNEL